MLKCDPPPVQIMII